MWGALIKNGLSFAENGNGTVSADGARIRSTSRVWAS